MSSEQTQSKNKVQCVTFAMCRTGHMLSKMKRILNVDKVSGKGVGVIINVYIKVPNYKQPRQLYSRG